jgi:hypothetical protein
MNKMITLIIFTIQYEKSKILNINKRILYNFSSLLRIDKFTLHNLLFSKHNFLKIITICNDDFSGKRDYDCKDILISDFLVYEKISYNIYNIRSSAF